MGNPKGNVDDIPAIAEVAHRHGLPLIVDNTMCPPPIFNPFHNDADLVVYSLTKMIGGHGTSVGGAVVEKGISTGPRVAASRAHRARSRLPRPQLLGGFRRPRRGGGAGQAFSLKVRTGVLRDLGPCISPFNSFLILQGLETLPMRARPGTARTRGWWRRSWRRIRLWPG